MLETQAPYGPSDVVTGLKWLTEPIISGGYFGDVWSCAWADDGNLYTVADDTWEQGTAWEQGACGSNLAIYRIDGGPRDATLHLINKMEAYGPAASVDGRASWKANGMTCVDGVLYLSVSRHYMISNCDNIQRTHDATIVKSLDYGQTWSPKPAIGKPMFDGSWFSTPFFVQYGQDYSGAPDEYVYAVSNNGAWNNGNYLVLGRVLRRKIGALDAADWEFFGGLDTDQHPIWVGDVLKSPAIFMHRDNTSTTDMQYVPAIDRYILSEWAYTSLDDTAHPFATSRLMLYEAPKPWGPWRHIHTEPDWNHASYNPGMPAKWFEDGGKRIWLTSSGDFKCSHCPGGSFEYYKFTVQQLELCVK